MAQQQTYVANDGAVQATNDDATSCKRSAVQLGYWRDPYLAYFFRSAERKAPEINRGYYARVHGIKLLIDQMIKLTDGNCQIVSFGAGFDTLFWRLKEDGLPVKNFVEFDFPTVTSRKCHQIKRTKPLLEEIVTEDGEVKFSISDLHSAIYHVVGADLRVIPEVQQKMRESDVDVALPTIFLAECVLVYMDVVHSSALLRWIVDTFSTAIFFNYEQVNMDDRFGQVMVDNLNKRGCSLSGVGACRDLESQKQRFLEVGWEAAEAWDMTQVYRLLPQADVQRMEKIEFLDEKELIEQLFQHYCISVAYKDGAKVGLSAVSFA